MFNRKVAVVLSLIMLFSLFMTGCNKSSQVQSTAEKENLIIAQDLEPTTLDPHTCYDAVGLRIIANMFDSLTYIDEKGQLVPCLASDWEISDDGLTYTFHLKSGVKFHNGDEFTSADAKYSFDRAIASPYMALCTKQIDKVEATDENTLVVNLKYPFSPFLKAVSRIYIVNEKAINELGDDYGNKPVGTGPYKFVEWVLGQNVKLERFDEYFQGAASIKNIEFRQIPEKSTMLIALENGEVDAAIDISEIDRQTVEKNEKLKLYECTSNFVESLGFNCQKAPFDNKLIRQAISYAIDKQAVINAALDGTGTITNSAVCELEFGYSSNVKGYTRDTEKAKQLLAEAGYPNGLEIEITAMEGYRKKAAEVIQSNLADVGIKANIELLEWGTLLSKCEKGEHETFVMEFGDAIYDAHYMLEGQFHSRNYGASGNFTFNNTPELDKLIDDASMELDEQKRLEMYEQAQNIVNDEALQVPLFSKLSNIACNKELKGVYAHPVGMYNIRDFSWQ